MQDEGFKSDIVSEPNDAQEGTVFRQSPDGGTEHDEGSTVQLLVSKGAVEVTVPNAVGVSETDARDRLAAVGLKANVVGVFADADPGEVVAQAPAAGESAAKGSTVRLNVSKGSKLVTVPSVVGSTEADANAGQGCRARAERRVRALGSARRHRGGAASHRRPGDAGLDGQV